MRHQPAAIAAILATTIVWAIGIGDERSPQEQTEPDRYEYVPPKNPAHQPIHDQMKQGRALEHLQELLSPLRLSYPLTIKVIGLRRRCKCLLQ